MSEVFFKQPEWTTPEENGKEKKNENINDTKNDH